MRTIPRRIRPVLIPLGAALGFAVVALIIAYDRHKMAQLPKEELGPWAKKMRESVIRP